jgi:hypothetical protein
MIVPITKLRFCILAIVLFLSTSNVFAQVSTGTIAGTVKDASGAMAVGATVTITNTSTGIVTRSVTSDTGFYSVPNLQTGPYTVSITAVGRCGRPTAAAASPTLMFLGTWSSTILLSYPTFVKMYP